MDGVPVVRRPGLLTGLLRDTLGLRRHGGRRLLRRSRSCRRCTGWPASRAEAGRAALQAGVDVELPTVALLRRPAGGRCATAQVPEELVDRAAARVLRQKCELGLLDADWPGAGDAADEAGDGEVIDLDSPAHRALARRLAEESVVLLANPDGVLPLPPGRPDRRGRPAGRRPAGDSRLLLLPRHVGASIPRPPLGLDVRHRAGGAAGRAPGAEIAYAARLRGPRPGPLRASRTRVAHAPGGGRGGRRARRPGRPVRPRHVRRGLRRRRPAAARRAGRPAAGPARRRQAGRPGARDRAALRDRAAWPTELAAVVQAFFPGEEGGGAIAGVLSGRVVPSGRLPVEHARAAGRPAVDLPAAAAGRAAPGELGRPDAAVRRSATACPTPASPTPTW